MSTFSDDHAQLVGRELPKARRDDDRMATLIGALTESLALAIVLAAEGDPDGINELCESISIQLLEGAAERAPLAGLLTGAA